MYIVHISHYKLQKRLHSLTIHQRQKHYITLHLNIRSHNIVLHHITLQYISLMNALLDTSLEWERSWEGKIVQHICFCYFIENYTTHLMTREELRFLVLVFVIFREIKQHI